MNTTVERPKPSETDEDLLRLQAEFLAKKEKDLQLKPKSFNTAQTKDRSSTKPQPHRFVLDLENLPEEPLSVLSDIQEANTEFLNEKRFDFHQATVSTEDGFPEVAPSDLTFDNAAEPDDGRSLFEREFDRRAAIKAKECSTSSTAMDQSTTEDDIDDEDFRAANDAKLKAMTKEQIEQDRTELIAKLDPKLIEFLRHRGQKIQISSTQDADLSQAKMKESRFKASKRTVQGTTNSEADEKRVKAEETAKNLEVMDETVAFDEDDYARRLAADPIQLDLAYKCMRSMRPHKEQAVLRLFDGFNMQESESKPNGSSLLNEAKLEMVAIKNVFLEKGWPESIRFSTGISPMTDGTWMFHPIRRTLDQLFAERNSGQKLQAEQIEAVRLSLLWSLLLLKERPSLFHACAAPADVYCRLAEVFLLGPDVFLETTVHRCLALFLDDYIIVQAQQGRLQFPLEIPIAGLDAFLPFYEDLLKRFEEWSYGDNLFAKTLLIPCYMNINLASATFLRMTLWSQEHSSIVQQILLHEKDIKLVRPAADEVKFQEEQNYENYSKLLVLYAAAIMNETVVRARNPLLFSVAAESVGLFIERHKNGPAGDFTHMANMLIKAVRCKLPI